MPACASVMSLVLTPINRLFSATVATAAPAAVLQLAPVAAAPPQLAIAQCAAYQLTEYIALAFTRHWIDENKLSATRLISVAVYCRATLIAAFCRNSAPLR